MSELSFQRDTASPTHDIYRQSPTARSVPDICAECPPSTLNQPRLVLVHDARPTDVTAIVEQELRQFAEYLASTFHHDIHRAQAHPPTWYRDQLGADECSYDDATFLRLLTMIACREHRALVITQPPADGRLQPLPHLDDVSLWEFWTGMAVVCAMMAAFFLYWWVSPTDQELREMQFGPHAVAMDERVEQKPVQGSLLLCGVPGEKYCVPAPADVAALGGQR